MESIDEIYVPHAGWLRHEAGDDVALFVQQGWFEAQEQAFLWLYLRDGDTVIDCGAHVGLFSILAGRAIGPRGRLIAFEPAPTTASLLRSNLQSNQLTDAVVIESAVADQPGTLKLHRHGEGRSAYNSLCEAGDDGGIDVTVTSLDRVIVEQNIEHVDFLKIDVEGFEPSVWRGAAASIQAAKLPLVMIEFTEENLQRAGHSSIELARTITDSGYHLCRFDPGRRLLIPTQVTEPIGYDNLFAARDIDAVNRRLADASPDRQRIAADILSRAAAAEIARRAEAIQREAGEFKSRFEHLQKACDERIERMNADIRQIIARAEHAEKSHEQTAADLRQNQGWLKITTQRAINSETRQKQLSDQLQQARGEIHTLQQQLFAFVTSKYEQLSWKAGLRKKPDWVDAFVAQQQTRAASAGDDTSEPPAQIAP